MMGKINFKEIFGEIEPVEPRWARNEEVANWAFGFREGYAAANREISILSSGVISDKEIVELAYENNVFIACNGEGDYQYTEDGDVVSFGRALLSIGSGHQQWIKCSERMPNPTKYEENYEELWVAHADGSVTGGVLWMDGEWYWDERSQNNWEITHWMPMSKPTAPEQEV